MNALKQYSVASLIVLVAAFSTLANANTPPTIFGPHGHAVEVSGKIKLMRAQMQGLEIGAKEDFLDAEVLITLEGQEDKVFGFRFHNDNPEAIAMANILKEAYFRGVPVTLSHKLEPKKNHLTIIWVQVGEYPNR